MCISNARITPESLVTNSRERTRGRRLPPPLYGAKGQGESAILKVKARLGTISLLSHQLPNLSTVPGNRTLASQPASVAAPQPQRPICSGTRRPLVPAEAASRPAVCLPGAAAGGARRDCSRPPSSRTAAGWCRSPAGAHGVVAMTVTRERSKRDQTQRQR